MGLTTPWNHGILGYDQAHHLRRQPQAEDGELYLHRFARRATRLRTTAAVRATFARHFCAPPFRGPFGDDATYLGAQLRGGRLTPQLSH